jgi:hypothetical protein
MSKDSAPQSVFVTVWRIFSDKPATKIRTNLYHFGGAPFLIQRLYDLAESYS